MDESRPGEQHCRFCGKLHQQTLLSKWDLDNFLQSNNLKKEHFSQIKFINWYSDVLPKTVCSDCYCNIKNIFVSLKKIEISQNELSQKCKNIQHSSIVSNIEIKSEVNNSCDLENEFSTDEVSQKYNTQRKSRLSNVEFKTEDNNSRDSENELSTHEMPQKCNNKQFSNVSTIYLKSEVNSSSNSENECSSTDATDDASTLIEPLVYLDEAANNETMNGIKLEMDISIKNELPSDEDDMEKDIKIYDEDQTVTETQRRRLALKSGKDISVRNKTLIATVTNSGCKVRAVKNSNESCCKTIEKLLKEQPGNVKAISAVNKRKVQTNKAVKEKVKKNETKAKLKNKKSDPSANSSRMKVEIYNQDISWSKYGWICLHCNMKSPSMCSIRVHSRAKHNTCYGFKCRDCDERFTRFFVFIEHARAHYSSLRLYCPYCDIKFSTPEECSTHTAYHYKTSCICELCGEMYATSSALYFHLLDTKEPVYENDHIKVVNVDVDRHSWKDYKWICQDCGFSAPDLGILKAHSQEYHKKCFSVKCIDCCTYIGDVKKFLEHVILHRSFLSDYCFHCDVNLKDNPGHELSHDSPDTCPKCGVNFQDDDSYQSHLMKNDIVKENYDLYMLKTCDVCFQNFDNLKVYMKHRAAHDVPTFDCTICEEKFLNRIELKSHLSDEHDRFGKTKVHCEVCKKSFMNKYLYSRHVKTHETKICHECGKSFMSARGIKRHMLQHTGAKPYPCLECDKTFADLANRRKHMSRIHKTPKQIKGWFPADSDSGDLACSD